MRDFDVLAIGAGIAGASIAAELAPFCRVGVVEQEARPGYHSTGRSAALFQETYGSEAVRSLSRASRAFFFDPPADFCDGPLTKSRGTLLVGNADQQRDIDRIAASGEFGPAARRMTADGALALCPILDAAYIKGAIYEPASADVDVNRLHEGYLRQARLGGAALHCSSPVTRISRTAAGWAVSAGEQEFRAPLIVNAAGAWADRVGTMAGAQPIGLDPRRRTAILVEPPAGFDIARWPFVMDVDEQFYFKPDAGLLLLSPADETSTVPHDVQAEELDIAVAVDRIERATTLRVRTIKHRWAGLRSFVPDRVPVVGFDDTVEGFFWLAAQGGYGIQTAPAIAKLAAALVLGQPVPPAIESYGVDPRKLSPCRLRAKEPAKQA